MGSSYTAYPDTVYAAASPKIPSSHLDVLNEFFRLIDTPTDDSNKNGQEIAALFLPDGVCKTPLATYSGKDELGQSRAKRWARLNSSKHDVLKLFPHDEEGKEFMMLGMLTEKFKDGRDEQAHFAARVEIENNEKEVPKLKFFQAWVTHR
ncbi:hypothetical protein NA57DRAFT_72192 [Rhizodiscina lignyota]|uniref:SnoaL-like domain-containing protein n=1 Tax=Rhizodiscina lignyota TaxID=1504668 RepID=A0A9P4MD84_9PEZI|nr:hypothetical protein NA57DRAFT_72192 [Rhizodiscina lignyota]